MANKKMEETGFSLPDKEVVVKPNFGNPGWIRNPKHAAFFKMEGTFDRLMAPQLRNGQLKDILTKEEKAFLEEKLQLEENGLSIYKKGKDNFWFNFIVRLGREPVVLRLSDPHDYIKYKVVAANTNLVASSIKNLKDGTKYKYYIEDKSEVAEIQETKSNINKKAWSAYGKMEDDKSKLRTFLITYSEIFGKATKKLDPDTKLQFLRSEVSTIVEERTKDFVDVIEDPDYETRAVIAEGIQTGVLQRQGLKYFITGGDKLGENLQDAVQTLKDPSNQETRLLLEQRIKQQK